jgi:hypothetical protein
MTRASTQVPPWRTYISPPEVVREVLRSTEVAFVREHGATPFITIRLEGEVANLFGGLEATAGDAKRVFAKPIGSLAFHTEFATAGKAGLGLGVAAEASTDALERGLLERFVGAPHYLIPLQKRAGVDAAFAERISVGRAPNRDIVLRHGSVSKFHAWFTSDAAGAFSLTDSGSKNGTRLNGEPLKPRESRPIQSGDEITFGSVRAAVCDARTLWRVLWKG